MQKGAVIILWTMILVEVIAAGCDKYPEVVEEIDYERIWNECEWIIPFDSVAGKAGNIGFRFCLINKDSIPANVFKEGEYFCFYFEFKNLSDEEITITDSAFYVNNFFMVYNEEGVLIGQPYKGIMVTFTMFPKKFALRGEQNRIFILPWVYGGDYNNFRNHTKPFNIVQENSFLSKGAYFCRFEMNLLYRIGGEIRDEFGAFLIDGIEKRIDELYFEINFKIE